MSQTAPKKSSYKKLFSNTVIFAIGSFSSKVLVLLLVNVYTTYLSQAELGINDVITQIANWLQPVFTMTISEAVIRFGLDKAYDKKNVFTIGNIVCFAGFAILGIILPIVTVSGIADKYLSGYSLLLYVYVVMSGLKLVYSTFVRSLEKVRLFAFNGILTTFFTLVGTVLFICGFKMGNTGYLLSIIMSDFLSVVFLMFAAKLWRYFDFRHIDTEVLRTMVQYSLPLIPAHLLWLITNSSDSFMTTHYMGQSANGILSASYKIPNLVATVYLMFGQAWNMSAILEDDSDDRNEFYSRVFNLNQCLLYILAAGCLMIVQPFTALWLGDDFQSSKMYSPILIYSSVFSCFTTFMGSIYLAAKETKRSMMTSLFSGIINVGLNIILIPTIGLYGPPISTVASYLTVFIIRAYDSRKIIPFFLNVRKIVLNNILLVAMVLINVLQFRFDSAAFSVVSLPILFIAVTVMNIAPLWDALQHLIPARIRRIIERLGTKRLIILCTAALAALAAAAALGIFTKGIGLYVLFGLLILFGLFTNRRVLLLTGGAMLFLSGWIFGSLALGAVLCAAAAFFCALATLRAADVLTGCVMLICACTAGYGIWHGIFCLTVELLVLFAIYAKTVVGFIERVLFKNGRKRKKKKKRKKAVS